MNQKPYSTIKAMLQKKIRIKRKLKPKLIAWTVGCLKAIK